MVIRLRRGTPRNQALEQPGVEHRSVQRVLQRLLADLMILAGISGVLVWAWAMLEGSLYQHIQKARWEKGIRPGGVAGDDVSRGGAYR